MFSKNVEMGMALNDEPFLLYFNELYIQAHARIQKVLSEGVLLCKVFWCVCVFQMIRGKRIQILLKPGHHRTTSQTPFKWRFAGGPMMAQFEAL